MHVSFLCMIGGGFCTSRFSLNGILHLHPSQTARYFFTYDGELKKLPTSVTLLSFATEYYPDMDLPKDFKSELLTASGDTIHISMNHIGRLYDYRFYQTSYDDQGGSVLTVTYDPVGIALTYTGFLLFTLGGIAWLLKMTKRKLLIKKILRAPKSKVVLAVGITIALLLLLAGMFGIKDLVTHPLLPVLASPWLAVHVSFLILAYAALGFTLPVAITALAVVRRRKRMISLAFNLLALGVFLLGLGIISGAMWANVSWGRYWAWDPKETWALVTLLLYSIPLHRYFKMQNQPKFCAIYLILVFSSIIMTYLGVNYLPSLHAYN